MAHVIENREQAGAGEKYIRRANTLMTKFIGGYAILVRILVSTKRYSEALSAMDEALTFPHVAKEYNWALGFLPFSSTWSLILVLN